MKNTSPTQSVLFLACIVAAVFAGCGGENVAEPEKAPEITADALVQEVEELMCLTADKETVTRLDGRAEEVRAILRKTQSPRVLKEFVYVLEGKLNQLPDGDTGRLMSISDSYDDAQSLAITRLGEIGGSESAKVLCEFLRDPEMSCDGERAFDIGEAITTCGKDALPYLQQDIPEFRRDFAQTLIGHIEAGTVFGP